MPISRRGFLGCAAGASAAGLAGAAALGRFFAPPFGPQREWILVDTGQGCPLQESAIGYAVALSSSKIRYRQAPFQPRGSLCGMILPAAGTTDSKQLAKLRETLESGSTVLYESAAGFLEGEKFSFHKRVIRSVFGLSLDNPVRLWDSADSPKQSPYLDYHWPVVTKVRDFSRIVPVDPGEGEPIAWFHGLPVAARYRIGKGTLVYLGSPLGPHLLSGDREAGRWLRAFCDAS